MKLLNLHIFAQPPSKLARVGTENLYSDHRFHGDDFFLSPLCFIR